MIILEINTPPKLALNLQYNVIPLLLVFCLSARLTGALCLLGESAAESSSWPHIVEIHNYSKGASRTAALGLHTFAPRQSFLKSASSLYIWNTVAPEAPWGGKFCYSPWCLGGCIKICLLKTGRGSTRLVSSSCHIAFETQRSSYWHPRTGS